MDKAYQPKEHEEKIYQLWETGKYFQPIIIKKSKAKPFSIILPPPNANGDLHFGHAMFTIEDILVRYHRMLGEPTLWLPGSDHAGFETQFVFEKKLAAEGKSRFDYSRDDLYQMIWHFSQNYRPIMEQQLKKLGFSLDWTRNKFTLDPEIIKIIYQTFKKMYDDGLVFRTERLVNYCTKDGTSFSDLEVVYEERKDPLYYIKYGPLTLATTRPETKFGDTGVAVHPQDQRYKKYIGQEIEIETVLGPAKIKVVADQAVDPKFGTGVVKITPAHDPTDFEIGQRHHLPLKQVIDFYGKLNKHTGKFAGLTVNQARAAVAREMEKKGLLVKIDENYEHRVGVCYKCKTVIEPLPLEQWFVKMEPLAKPAIEAVKKGKIKIFPKSFAKIYFQFLENIKDWNISRQIVWGIRIPAWKCDDCGKWIVTEGEEPKNCAGCQSKKLTQDPDTFDTWFSSAQWPFATLKTASPGDFARFYPTTVMETGYEILRWWVTRMIMIGLYATGQIPFKYVVLHGMVKDPYGKKMSKSRGNVVNPLELIEEYGADAVRFALIYGTAMGNDQSLSHPKLKTARNFTNKIWNIARFVLNANVKIRMHSNNLNSHAISTLHPDDKWIIDELNKTIKIVISSLNNFRLHDAASEIYDFIWHKFADIYIEKSKDRRSEAQSILEYVFKTSLELLHPFMPFITEELWQQLPHTGKSIMISRWPKVSLKLERDKQNDQK